MYYLKHVYAAGYGLVVGIASPLWFMAQVMVCCPLSVPFAIWDEYQYKARDLGVLPDPYHSSVTDDIDDPYEHN